MRLTFRVLQNLPSGSRIGIDPLIFTACKKTLFKHLVPMDDIRKRTRSNGEYTWKTADANKLETELSKVGSSLVPVPNLVDLIWNDRPSRPARPLLTLDTTAAGKSHTTKIQELRQDLARKGVAGCVISGLDEIAWLFNMRGSDVHCNPVFFAYAIITQESTRLYLQQQSVSKKVKDHLGSTVQIKPYETIYEDLKDLSGSLKGTGERILLGTKTNMALSTALGKDNVIETRSPVIDAKAIKNETELEGMRRCHLRDAAAVINYFAWLEEQLTKGVTLDEADGAERLQLFRA